MSCKIKYGTVCFKTFGCKVNQYETQLLRENFIKAGFREQSKNNSRLHIINTCSLTANTDRKIRQYVNEVKRINPQSRIFLLGCAVFNPESGLKSLEDVEIFEGRDKRDVLKLLCKASAKNKPINTISGFEEHERAFVKIQDGCNNFCSYCVVPYLRGKPKSRPPEEILTEIKTLVDNSFREIVLTGINIGVYKWEGYPSLAYLIKKVLSVRKNFRVRLSSIEPNYVTPLLIDLMAEDKRFCPHFHIPLQSADDKILKLMNRGYSARDYFILLEKIRKQIENISITTDLIVGFPQETEAVFKNNIRAVEKAEFLRTHIFSYSPRSLTASVKIKGHLCREAVNVRRKAAFLTAQKTSFLFRKKFLNKKLSSLIESRKNKLTSRNLCFTDNYIEVQVQAKDDFIGKIMPVEITAVNMNGTFAKILKKNAPQLIVNNKQFEG